MTDTSAKSRAGRIILFSLIANLTVWLLSLLCSSSWDDNDDIAMQGLLYGVYGTSGTSNLVFINRLLGVLLLKCAEVLPFNVYIAMHISIYFASSVFVTAILADKFGKKGALFHLIWLTSVFECYCLPQFTKTAGVAAIAGVLGLLHFTAGKRSHLKILVSMLFVVAACMVRSESLKLVLLALSGIMIYVFVEKIRVSKDMLVRYAVVCVVAVILVAGTDLVGNALRNSGDADRAYNEYNVLRSSMVDNYNHAKNVGVVASEMSDNGDMLGLTEICMVNSWMHNDPEVFTADRMRELNGILDEASSKPSPALILNVMRDIVFSNLSREPIFLLLLILCVNGLIFSDKRLYAGYVLLVYLFLNAYTVYNGRYNVHRVNYLILLSCIVTLMYVIGIPDLGNGKDLKSLLKISVVLLPVAFACIFMILNLVTTTGNIMNAAYDRYEKCSQILDPNERYMVQPDAGIAGDPSVSIYSIPAADTMHAFPMGGWMCGLPVTEDVVMCDIKGNPWTECVDSEDIRLLMPSDDDGYCIKLVESYIYYHYGIKSEETLERSNEYYC